MAFRHDLELQGKPLTKWIAFTIEKAHIDSVKFFRWFGIRENANQNTKFTTSAIGVDRRYVFYGLDLKFCTVLLLFYGFERTVGTPFCVRSIVYCYFYEMHLADSYFDFF